MNSRNIYNNMYESRNGNGVCNIVILLNSFDINRVNDGIPI